MLRTRVFALWRSQGGGSLRGLARRMDLSHVTVAQVKRDEQGIGRGFIEGAFRAFPGLSFEQLFYHGEAESDQQALDAINARAGASSPRTGGEGDAA